ncbi:hypothetical protein JCM10449v2_003853 [Rhodotorula kratochvilovae]
MMRAHRNYQRRTESFDDEPDDDPRWQVFDDVAVYLQETFPLVHERLALEKVNSHGLLYAWQGSDSTLKPTLLMSHQDVVPVNPDTVDHWTHPPWSGYYDGEYLWGRGAVDTKNTLTAILEAVTLLLSNPTPFNPRRTVLLAFGFDEESRGYGGAGEIARVLEERYGQDGIAFLVDEGGLGVGETAYGVPMALPATTEKGYLNVNFTLFTAGGHSSVPPEHSGIGLLSSIITTLESHPFSPSLPLSSPVFSTLECAAAHGSLSPSLKRNVARGSATGRKGARARSQLAHDFAALGRQQRFTVQTSQAVDVIRGGVKVNALPEVTSVLVNYRVAIDSSPAEVKARLAKTVEPVARRYGLKVNAFGAERDYAQEEGKETVGELKLTAGIESEASRISPTDSAAWSTFAGTIRHAFGPRFPSSTSSDPSSTSLIVAPALMLGNTDVRYYLARNLTQHAYRFSPLDRARSPNAHTVDERLYFEDHLAGVWFYHELVRNADAAQLE